MYTVLPVLPEQTYANNMVTYGDIIWWHMVTARGHGETTGQILGPMWNRPSRDISPGCCWCLQHQSLQDLLWFFKCLNRHGISPTVVLFFLGRLEIYDLKSVWSGKNTGCQANQSRLVQWTVNSCILQIKHMWNIGDLCACNLYGKIATIRIYSVTHEVFDSVR